MEACLSSLDSGTQLKLISLLFEGLDANGCSPAKHRSSVHVTWLRGKVVGWCDLRFLQVTGALRVVNSSRRVEVLLGLD